MGNRPDWTQGRGSVQAASGGGRGCASVRTVSLSAAPRTPRRWRGPESAVVLPSEFTTAAGREEPRRPQGAALTLMSGFNHGKPRQSLSPGRRHAPRQSCSLPPGSRPRNPSATQRCLSAESNLGSTQHGHPESKCQSSCPCLRGNSERGDHQNQQTTAAATKPCQSQKGSENGVKCIL